MAEGRPHQMTLVLETDEDGELKDNPPERCALCGAEDPDTDCPAEGM